MGEQLDAAGHRGTPLLGPGAPGEHCGADDVEGGPLVVVEGARLQRRVVQDKLEALGRVAPAALGQGSPQALRRAVR